MYENVMPNPVTEKTIRDFVFHLFQKTPQLSQITFYGLETAMNAAVELAREDNILLDTHYTCDNHGFTSEKKHFAMKFDCPNIRKGIK